MKFLRRALLVSCCLCSAALLAADDDASEADLESLERAIASAREEVAELDNQRSDLAAVVEASERAISTLVQQTNALQLQLNDEQGSLATLQQQASGLDMQRLEQQELLAAYLRSAWMNGHQESLKLLLSQQDATRTARLLRYYQYFGQARSERIASFNDTLEQIEATRAAIIAGSARLTEQQTELSQRQRELDGKKVERSEKLANLEAELKAGKGKLNDLEQQRIEQQLLLEELRSANANKNSGGAFFSKKGSLPWPVQGKISHAFGTRYELGDLSYEGVLLNAPAGTAVNAIHGGRVVFADWFGNSGLLLIIDHGDGYMSLYAHNQQLFKPVGASVETGEKIATVGNTGDQSETGLYFELRQDGKAVNPALWCKN